jgi:hypothetical protein
MEELYCPCNKLAHEQFVKEEEYNHLSLSISNTRITSRENITNVILFSLQIAGVDLYKIP